MKKILVFIFVVAACFSSARFVSAASFITQTISLSSGWNIISPQRIVESHEFSATENSSNFDIYLLNASSTSGWSTMAELNQSEFTPLYGYFINNKTGSAQTLTLTYKENLSPNERLFERKFVKTGWYSIGVANPTYVVGKNVDTTDTNNVANILDSLSGSYSTVLDFTQSDFASVPSSVRVGEVWKSVVPGDLNSLNDLRETKGYAVYITKENGLYNGFQNNDNTPSIASISPTGVTAGASDFTLTVSGYNFTPSSTVRWNGSDVATTYSSSTQISALILASNVATATTTKISVFNPGPSGGISSEKEFNITSSGNITLQRASDSPSSAVIPSSNNVILAKFTVNPSVENYELRQVKFWVSSGGNNMLSGNIYIKVNGSIVYSVAATSISTSSPSTINLSTYPILTHDQSSTITIEGSISSTATASDTYQIKSFDLTSAKRLVSNDLLSDGEPGLNVSPVDSLIIPVQIADLSLSLISGSGASPSANQVVGVGTTNGVYLAFKLTSQFETQKITSLKLSTTGAGLSTSTLLNIRLYEGSAMTPFASASQFDVCRNTECSVVFTASDNLLSAPVPLAGITIYAKADIAPGGIAVFGSEFKFGILNPNVDMAIKGSVSGTISNPNSTTAIIALGTSYIVSQSVRIEAVSPTTATQVGTSAGQTVAVFKVTNNGTAPISLSSSTMTFTNGGSATTTTNFKIYASAMGGGQSDTSGWNSGNGHLASAGTTGASSSISFATTTFTAAERKIDGGSWRYLTIRNSGALSNNDTFQFSVSALGNILFNVDEADIGYSGNSDADLSDTILGLYADGIPALSTVTAKV